VFIFQFRFTDKNAYVRIEIRPCLRSLNAEVGTVYLTGAVLKLTAQFKDKIDHNPAMLQRGSGHWKHFAVEILAPGFRLTLKGKVFLRRHAYP